MNKKKSSYQPRITVDWTPEGAIVSIRTFENLSPAKIDKCFQAALKEWYRLRSAHINDRRRREQEAASPIGAENG